MKNQLDKYLTTVQKNPGFGGMAVESAIIISAILEFQDESKVIGSMAEIGVFRGFGASLFASYLSGEEKIFLIDPFVEKYQFIDSIVECSGHAIENKLEHIKLDSTYLARNSQLFNHHDLRFFHIDGEHSFDAVLSDLTLAARSISNSGVIVIDDFFNPACPAVTHAVFSYIDKHAIDLSIFLIGYNKAYLCRNRSLGFYRRFIVDLPQILYNRSYSCQLTSGGFSFERTYSGICSKDTDKQYQIIGRYVGAKDEFLNPLKSY